MEVGEEENLLNGRKKQKTVVTLMRDDPIASGSSMGKTHKRKPSPPAVDDGKLKQQLLESNKFAKLAATSLDTEGNTAHPVPKAKAVPVVSPPENTTSNEKQPPLVVKNVDFSTLIDKMEKCEAKPVYKITRFGTKLLCSTAEEYTAVKNHLIECGLEFYSHDRPNQRPYRVVVRGLPTIDPKALVTCLKEQHELVAQSAHIIRRKGECAALDEKFHLVCFEKGHTNLKKLREVTTIASIAVRWEAYRNKRADATQCLNCLYHGHGTRNCHLKGRCNHCGEAHVTEECPKKETKEKKCANCDGAHPATDHSCPKRAEYIRIRQKASVANQPGRKTRSRNPPALTLADFPPLSNNSAPAGPSNVSSQQAASNAWATKRPIDPRTRVGNLNEGSSTEEADAMPLFSAAECWAIFTEFCGRLQHCKSRKDQFNVIGDMACRYGVK